MNVSSKLMSKLKPFLWLTIASAIYAVGFNWCYKPNAIAFGGLAIPISLGPDIPRPRGEMEGNDSLSRERGV